MSKSKVTVAGISKFAGGGDAAGCCKMCGADTFIAATPPASAPRPDVEALARQALDVLEVIEAGEAMRDAFEGPDGTGIAAPDSFAVVQQWLRVVSAFGFLGPRLRRAGHDVGARRRDVEGRQGAAANGDGTMTFDDWFRAQFGDPPTEQDRAAVEECLRGCEARAREYRALLARIDEYETRRDAALKAWCARTVKL